MKRFGHLMELVAAPENLELAFAKARRGKSARPEVRTFAGGLRAELSSLRKDILSGEVSVGDYEYFRIRDPKPRLICAASFRERVLHHALMNVCHPVFERGLSERTHATRPGHGIYTAIAQARANMRGPAHCAKLDVRKYFDSIDHGVLMGQLSRLFKDKALLTLFGRIVASYDLGDGRGLPIGNLTSQYFANHYLAHADRLLQGPLGLPKMTRYMDDLLVFNPDRDFLAQGVGQLRGWLRESLLLELKPPRLLRPGLGVPFLGYSLFPHKLLLSASSKRRMSLKLGRYLALWRLGLWSDKRLQAHLLPLWSFAQKSDSGAFLAGLVRRHGLSDMGK